METVINTKNLTKQFKLYLKKPSSLSFLKSYFTNNNTIYVWKKAVDNLNIEVKKNEKIAVIGNNGAGKTTVLKLLAGLIQPTSGTITRKGKVIYLAGLGIGMSRELSVEQNIYLYSKIYGTASALVKNNIDEILEWAELEEFRYANFKTLSSGMKSRLAFSTARYIETDIYLLDEALTGGDKNFRKKCVDYLNRNIKIDKTYIISSHLLDLAENLCDKALWMNMGKMKMFGDAKSVIKEYSSFNSK